MSKVTYNNVDIRKAKELPFLFKFQGKDKAFQNDGWLPAERTSKKFNVLNVEKSDSTEKTFFKLGNDFLVYKEVQTKTVKVEINDKEEITKKGG